MRPIYGAQLQPRIAAGVEAASAGLLAARVSEQRGHWWPGGEDVSHGRSSARPDPCSRAPAGHLKVEPAANSSERLGFVGGPVCKVVAPKVKDHRTTARSAFSDPSGRESVVALNEGHRANRVFAQEAQKAALAGGDWHPKGEGRGEFQTTHASAFVAHDDACVRLFEAAEARHYAYLGAQTQSPAGHPQLTEKERLLSLNRADFAPFESRVSHQRAWTADAMRQEFLQARDAAYSSAEALNFQGIKEKPTAERPAPCKAFPHMPLGHGPPAAGQRPGAS
eukprot:TRINITY_DN534_c0_g2_i1.p1 TRINITY_DN534_c0_g2~~TRINITY_DN534_c0_g2_i1.p1  ORF type:complete len:280 (+),score=47.05 TRINITY_DN534_c0_g2_i1:11-850(+)